jgi:CPA1 family monovalent cation:H+ antiporter
MEEREARLQMVSAAIDQINILRGRRDSADEAALADLLHHYQQLLEVVNGFTKEDGAGAVNYEHYHNLSSQLRAVERSTVLGLRDQNKINDEVLRTLEQELDLLDARYQSTHH